MFKFIFLIFVACMLEFQNENGEDWNLDDPMQIEEFLADLDTKDPYVLTVVPSGSVRQRIAACKHIGVGSVANDSSC